MSILQSSLRGVLFALSIAAATTAHSQGADNDVLRRTQMQLRQSEQERNSLRNEVARLQSQLGSHAAELDMLRQRAEQAQSSSSSTAAELSARTSRLNQTSNALRSAEAELETLRAENARQSRAAQNLSAMLTHAERISAQRQELVELCRTRNQELYTTSSEILTMYRDKDFSSLAKREPVLQLQQVKLQNLVQDFEDRLRTQRMHEDTLPPSVERAMQEELQRSSANRGDDAAS